MRTSDVLREGVIAPPWSGIVRRCCANRYCSRKGDERRGGEGEEVKGLGVVAFESEVEMDWRTNCIGCLEDRRRLIDNSKNGSTMKLTGFETKTLLYISNNQNKN